MDEGRLTTLFSLTPLGEGGARDEFLRYELRIFLLLLMASHAPPDNSSGLSTILHSKFIYLLPFAGEESKGR